MFRAAFDHGGGPDGLAVESDGALYVRQNGGVFDGRGTGEAQVEVIRDDHMEYLADGMGAPDDLVFEPGGSSWVTNTRCEIDFFDPNKNTADGCG